MEPKVIHRYTVKTMATIFVGDNEIKVPVEFNMKEMSWDKGKSLDQILQETFTSAHVHFSLKKKHLTIEQEF